MVWKAKIAISDYKAGDVVPDKIAQTWNVMYKESPVVFVEDAPVASAPVPVPKKNMDLNGDGKVDKQDSKIASKVMNTIKYDKKKK